MNVHLMVIMGIYTSSRMRNTVSDIFSALYLKRNIKTMQVRPSFAINFIHVLISVHIAQLFGGGGGGAPRFVF